MNIIERKGGKKLNLTILIFLLLLGAIGFVGVDSFFNNLYSQYPVVSYDTQVNDRITKIDSEHGTLLTDMSKGLKIGIVLSSFKNYNSSAVYNLIEIGDSLIKKANSDSIRIKKNETIYLLVLKIP
jgi:hypothetical protein